MISRILLPDDVVCISPEHCMEVCGSAAGCSNVAYPRLVMSVMPVGLRGLMMAVMIAALMSDLDSIFNSASTIFTLDIYKMLKKQASPGELLIVGRLFVVFMVIVSIAWVPVIIEMQGGQMFYYIQEVSDYLTPPIAVLFLLGVLCQRCNETGAFWGGMVGFMLGSLRLVLALVYREPHCNQPDERPSFIKDVHFMYVAAILFWVTAAVTVTVSLCTPAPREEQIRTTTLWGLNKRKKLKRERTGEDVTTLKRLNNVTLNGNSVISEEIGHSHLNVLTVTENQTSNGTAVTESHRTGQNDSYMPTPDPTLVEQGAYEEEEGCFRRVEDEKCIKALEWLCGFKENPSRPQVITVQEQEKMVEERLHEPPATRIILNIGMLLICSIGVFLFVYFSV